MAQSEEQNRSEEATPFKLQKAREKGSLARGIDLGFFSATAGFLLFLTLSGTLLASQLMGMMRSNLSDFTGLEDPHAVLRLLSQDAKAVMGILVVVGLTLMIIAVPLEILQLRGLVFSSQPLKPDFSRLNPARGLKRLFSLRMVKEAFKSVLKLALYTLLGIFAIRFAVLKAGYAPANAMQLTELLWKSSLRLLILFSAAALVIAAIDQIIARKEFAKQMRMSRRELTREYKEREGEPRIKSRRKQLHAEFIKQTAGLKNLAGSDLVLVNPEHFAIALAYDGDRMAAPTVRAKARNSLALAMKKEAARLNIAVISDPPLARALFRSAEAGRQIGQDHYRSVAAHYSSLRELKRQRALSHSS